MMNGEALGGPQKKAAGSRIADNTQQEALLISMVRTYSESNGAVTLARPVTPKKRKRRKPVGCNLRCDDRWRMRTRCNKYFGSELTFILNICELHRDFCSLIFIPSLRSSD